MAGREDGSSAGNPGLIILGAVAGAAVGALAKARHPRASSASHEEPVSRKSGPLVAAEVDDRPQQFSAACDVIAGLEAFEVEEADGTIRDGDWIDFDPRLTPRIIIATKGSAAVNTITRPHRGDAHP